MPIDWAPVPNGGLHISALGLARLSLFACTLVHEIWQHYSEGGKNNKPISHLGNHPQHNKKQFPDLKHKHLFIHGSERKKKEPDKSLPPREVGQT